MKNLNIQIPSFKFYNHSFTKFLSDDTKYHLSLKKITGATKKDSMVFQTLAEPLLEGLINIRSN